MKIGRSASTRATPPVAPAIKAPAANIGGSAHGSTLKPVQAARLNGGMNRY